MTPNVFGTIYSDAYDLLYQDKDYGRECDFLEAIFQRCGLKDRAILDLGCGTGGHAIPLTQRGYHVVGVDRSPIMLEIARRKAQAAGAAVEFVEGDIRDVNLGRTFDAVIAMFAVMCYQTSNADLAAVCRTARRHLKPGGGFAFDGWHGPGVLTDRPTQRVKIVQDGKRRVVRFTEPVLDTMAHTVETRFKVWIIDGERIVSETDETHMMRFLFPQEISFFLETAGFEYVEFCPFLEIDRNLDDTCWNMMVMAKAGLRSAEETDASISLMGQGLA